MIRVAIVEDERVSAQALNNCLRRYGEENGTEFDVHFFTNAVDFLEAYRHNFEIVFMDVSMPGMNGMEASHRLREMDTQVVLVFVTSLAQYAVEGYEVDALDFVVKPVNYYSFKMKIKKALAAASRNTGTVLTVPYSSGFHYLKASDILYIEVQTHELIYHTVSSGNVTASGTLKTVEIQLMNDGFFRCNYCYLVNLNHVSKVVGNIVVVGGDELQISRNRKREFLQRLAQYYGQGGR